MYVCFSASLFTLWEACDVMMTRRWECGTWSLTGAAPTFLFLLVWIEKLPPAPCLSSRWRWWWRISLSPPVKMRIDLLRSVFFCFSKFSRPQAVRHLMSARPYWNIHRGTLLSFPRAFIHYSDRLYRSWTSSVGYKDSPHLFQAVSAIDPYLFHFPTGASNRSWNLWRWVSMLWQREPWVSLPQKIKT